MRGRAARLWRCTRWGCKAAAIVFAVVAACLPAAEPRGAPAADTPLGPRPKQTVVAPLVHQPCGSACPASCLQVGGPNFKADALSRVANESGHKLETEVLAPLTRWQDVHLQLVVSAAAV